MIVWITHVKVGHRQTSIPKPPAHEDARGVLLCTDLIQHPARHGVPESRGLPFYTVLLRPLKNSLRNDCGQP